MRVDEAELARRRTEWKPTAPIYERSFAALYQRHVSQADQGCDFDFLSGPGAVSEPSIF
jgi:dihydroxy-acid dehydratase